MTKNPFSLDGQVALIAGGSRGLGLAIARSLGEAGAAVLVNGRDAAAAESAASALRGAGIEAAALSFDIADAGARDAGFRRIAAERQRLDILVAAAGMRRRAAFEALRPEDFRALAAVNLEAGAALAQAALPFMLRQGRGRIVFVTSIAGPIARAGDAAYTATKAGLAGLAKALAVEFGGRGVTTNAIAPGYFATEANSAMIADKEVEAFLKRRCPLGRWGEPREVGGAAVFLASEAGAYVNGHVLTVDGGLSAAF
jgi:gluconate 5-dehydrogenase